MKAVVACLFGLGALLVGGVTTATLAVVLTPVLLACWRLLLAPAGGEAGREAASSGWSRPT
jgi:hypothetical protein